MHGSEVDAVYQDCSRFLAGLEGSEETVFSQGSGSVEAAPLQYRLQRNLRIAAVYAFEFLDHRQYMVG